MMVYHTCFFFSIADVCPAEAQTTSKNDAPKLISNYLCAFHFKLFFFYISQLVSLEGAGKKTPSIVGQVAATPSIDGMTTSAAGTELTELP